MSSSTADRAPSASRCLWFKQRRVQVGKILQFQSGNFPADEMFDRLQSGQFLATCESKCVADVLRPAGASDAMHVIFRMLGHIVINDMTHAGDVESARCDVGRHHHFVFAALESLERFDPFALCPIGMQHGHGMLSLF